MAIDYSNFTGPDGTTDNAGGGTNRIWFAPKSYFNVIQDVKALDDGTVTTYDEYAVISQTHTFQTGKGFHLLYSTTDRSEGEAAVQGEIDGRSMKMEGKGFYPGLSGVILGFFRKAKNDNFIILLEMLDGKIWQFGTKRLFAQLIATKIGTAKNSSGVKGTEYNIQCMESAPYLYTGTITLHP